MARDFFDELSDTITRTTKDLGKKAGQLYEAQKIRSKISSEEQMVQKLKADIGNVIFEKYKEGAEVEEALKGFCEEIEQHLDIIDGYKDAAAEMKGRKMCIRDNDNPASKMYAFEAGKRAIEAHLERTGVKGTVSHTPDLGFYRVKYPVQGHPLVSIIIPNKDEKETLEKCLESIKKNTLYDNYEIIIVENNSTTDEIFDYYRKISEDPRIHLICWKKEFNYSAINNFGVKNARGEYLLFLNNDVTVITEDWMGEMLGVCQRREVGAVGAVSYTHLFFGRTLSLALWFLSIRRISTF